MFNSKGSTTWVNFLEQKKISVQTSVWIVRDVTRTWPITLEVPPSFSTFLLSVHVEQVFPQYRRTTSITTTTTTATKICHFCDENVYNIKVSSFSFGRLYFYFLWSPVFLLLSQRIVEESSERTNVVLLNKYDFCGYSFFSYIPLKNITNIMDCLSLIFIIIIVNISRNKIKNDTRSMTQLVKYI